eukprot:scaffold51780_cov50-Attheya_sp.AAC.2
MIASCRASPLSIWLRRNQYSVMQEYWRQGGHHHPSCSAFFLLAFNFVPPRHRVNTTTPRTQSACNH